MEGECGAVLTQDINLDNQIKPRLFKEKEVDVYKKVFYKNDVQAKLASLGDQQVVLFKDKMVSVSQTVVSLQNKKCIQVKKGNVIHGKDFFLCESKFNQSFVFTDKQDIEVIIDEDEL